MKIDGSGKAQEELNELVRSSKETEYEITGLLGQRFIAAGRFDNREKLTATVSTPEVTLLTICFIFLFTLNTSAISNSTVIETYTKNAA